MACAIRAFAAAGVALAVAGCSMLPFGLGDDRPVSRAPAPVAAAPAGAVVATPLPPPVSAEPAVPASGLAALDPVEPSSPAPPLVPGNVEIARPDLVGGWTVAAAGDSCQLFMTLTTWAGGYRASTRGCNNAALKTVSAWNLEGGQVQLIADSGATVARLYAASKTQFNGQTEGGGPISVSR